MVELTVNGAVMDMPKKGSAIKYTKQIADVFDIASVSNSYTNSFSIPKTPNNTRAFEDLGIVGDVSSIPYSKATATLSEFGFPLVRNGWLNVKETADSYPINHQS